MSAAAECIDLTSEMVPNKRQRLAEAAEPAASSSSEEDPEPPRTGRYWGYPPGMGPNKPKNAKPNKTLTSPEADVRLYELGTVRLPCETVKQAQPAQAPQRSIHSLKQRLAPYGFQQRCDGFSDIYNDKLCMDNLFERHWKYSTDEHSTSHYESCYINLDPSPIHLPPLPTQQRVQPVTVVHSDGSEAPVTYGIPIDWNATNQQLMDGVRRQCDLPGDKQVVLVQLDRNLFGRFFKPEQPVHKAPVTGGHHNGQWVMTEFGGEMSFYSDSDDDMGASDSSDALISNHANVESPMVPKCKKLSGTVAYIVPKPGHSAEPMTNMIIYTNTGSLPLMVPIKTKWSTGGIREADKHVRAAIKTALIPAGLAKSSRTKCPAFQLNHSDRYGNNLGQPFTGPMHCYRVPDLSCSCLCAIFDLGAMIREYDLKVMAEPTVHASAVKQILEESAEGLAQLKEYETAKAEAQEQPWLVVTELVAASRHMLGPNNVKWPSVRVSLNLEPESDRPKETRGTAVIKVWCWKSGLLAVPAHQRLMQDLDDWSAVKDFSYEYSGQNRLRSFMAMVLRGQPHHDHLQAELTKWLKKDTSNLRTLPGLMQLLQADERPESDQPEGLEVQLRPYQRQSLRFMMDSEDSEGGFRHHLFCQVTNSKGNKYWYSPVLGRLCEKVEAMSHGGILGEEMGLGKTVEVAALVLSLPAPPLQSNQEMTADGQLISRATLIVCPVTLMGQWADELADKAGGSLKVLTHHGPKRAKDPEDLVDYDVVLVTYQTLGQDFSKGLKGCTEDGKNLFPPCGSIQWYRIVLDEGHTVKNPNAQLTKACIALQGNKRWCVTGTPVGTDIADLQGQFSFLRLHPFTNKNFFSVYVKSAYAGSAWARGPADKLLYILGQCMIRHTKLQVLGGEEILQLPKKSEELVPVVFTQAEQELYIHVFERARAKYHMFRSQGPLVVSKRLIQIMSTLLPLRRICSGGQLCDKDLAVELPESVGRVSMAVDPSAVCTEEACCICFESPIREPTRTKCNHWFCWECIGALLQAGAGSASHLVCPLCRAKVQGQELVKGVNEGAGALQEEDSYTAKLEQQASTSESKLTALLEELRVMREKEPSAKALVFSQFASTIDWLKVKLQEQGFGYRTISGSMTLKQRSKAIEAFQKDPPTTVFLLSMRSGSVGINLTSANHVFILEPALNPALEEQAIGRAWRMGQQRPVTVKRFHVKGSVEDRIVEMVRHRREGGCSQQPSTSSGYTWTDLRLGFAAANNDRVKAQDILGSMKADKQNLRVEELDLLFQPPNFNTVQ